MAQAHRGCHGRGRGGGRGRRGLGCPAGRGCQRPLGAVRQCESGGNYSVNTGSGFYGAYQMTADAWHSVGFSGLPSDASPAMQDEAASRLYARYGTSPWPVCGKRYGGSSSGTTSSGGYSSGYSSRESSSAGHSAGAMATNRTSSHQVLSYPPRQATVSRDQDPGAGRHAISQPTQPPVLDIRLVGQTRQDVRLYQIALGWLGYQLAADGRFGPITALTTKRFQADHGLLVDGRVGPQTRAAIAQAL